MASISRKHFQLLYKSFLQKAKADYQKSNQEEASTTQIFELENHDSRKDTVRKLMLAQANIVAYLKEQYPKDWESHCNPRYLYNKRSSDYKKKKLENIVITRPYDVIIPMYLGFSSLNAFIEQQEKEEKEKEDWVNYQGYYYSFLHHAIKTFELEINYTSKIGELGNAGEYEARERGFHDDDQNPEYKGYAYRMHGSKLHVVLDQIDIDKPKKNRHQISDKLKMVFDAGANPKRLDILRGSILGISAALPGNPILSIETVIIKKSQNLTSRQKLNIERYLHLHRCNFWVRPIQLDVDDILVNKTTNVDRIQHLTGIYRVWRFDEDYQVVQSKMIIKDNYETICYTNLYDREIYKKQVCLLRINNIRDLRSETICITSHPKKGTGVLSYIILKTASKSEWKKMETKVLGGSLSFVGKDHEFPLQRAIALEWMGPDGSDVDLPLATYTLEEAEAMQERKDLFALLKQLTKKDVPPF